MILVYKYYCTWTSWYKLTRSSGRYAPFLLAPAEGWGGGPLWGPPRMPPIYLDPYLTLSFSTCGIGEMFICVSIWVCILNDFVNVVHMDPSILLCHHKFWVWAVNVVHMDPSILLCHHKSKTAVARACMHGFGSNFVCKLIGPSRNFFVFLANWIRALLIWFLGGGTIRDTVTAVTVTAVTAAAAAVHFVTFSLDMYIYRVRRG